MNFDFSDEQRQLQSAARRMLEKECTLQSVRAVLDGNESCDAALWATMADMGFQGAAIPDANGGLGLGYLELCVIAEELGRALAPAPFETSVGMFTELLKCAGSDAQKAAYLPLLAQGRLIGTVAAFDLECVRGGAVDARVSGSVLNGIYSPVVDGACADAVIVAAYEDQDAAPSLFIADLRATDVERTPLRSIDPSRKCTALRFENFSVERIGARGAGYDLLAQAYDIAAVLVAFEQLGGAERALFMARDYALQRFAFGRPIGSFQAVKHELADMFVSLSLARANCLYAAWTLEAAAAERAEAAAAARVSATLAFQHCSTSTIQLHGGIGFTWAFDAHLFYRRSNFLALSLGSQSAWEAKLIDRVCARRAA